MLLTSVIAQPLRSLAAVEVALEDGVTAVLGENGSGKTNLLEALYFALTGRSFRTADRRELIPFSESLARAEASVRDEDGTERRFLASVSRAEGRRHLLDGSARRLHHRGPQPARGRRLRAGPPGAGQGSAGRASRSPRPLRGDSLGRLAPACDSGSVRLSLNETRSCSGPRRRPRACRRARLLGLDPGRGLSAADRIALRGDRRAGAAFRGGGGRARAGGSAHRSSTHPRAEGSAEELKAGLIERREADLRLGRTSWGPHLDEV